MKEYVLNEKDIDFLKKALYAGRKSFTRSQSTLLPTGTSILKYKKVCDHDDGYFCEHRLEWLINYIENKEIRTRKVKLEKINDINED
jgi:hypothetical protein